MYIVISEKAELRELIGNMSDTTDLDQQIEQLRKCEVIKEHEVKNLCAKAREILGECVKTTDMRLKTAFQLRRAMFRE